jgi:predicted TPR repeat methyltransferase
MSYRALELLALPENETAFLLDIGCGSGLSGEILEDEGHVWVGCDVAPSMLGSCRLPAVQRLHSVPDEEASERFGRLLNRDLVVFIALRGRS